MSIFKLGDEVQTTREAIEWGAALKPLRGRVVGFSWLDGEFISVRIARKGGQLQARHEVWHESFWELIPHEISPREDMWGDRKQAAGGSAAGGDQK